MWEEHKVASGGASEMAVQLAAEVAEDGEGEGIALGGI